MGKITENNSDNGDRNNVNIADIFEKYVIESIENKRPFFRGLMKNPLDAEDLEQEVKFKLFKKTQKNLNWFNELDKNLDAYVFTTAKNIASDMREKIRHHESYDDTENISGQKSLSDKGGSVSQLNRKLDKKTELNYMNNTLLRNFSEYDAVLIKLNQIAKLTPGEIAEFLLKNCIVLLKTEFPEYSELSEEEFAKKMQIDIPKDCNLAKGKYRQKLMKKLKHNVKPGT
jgi:DNA-directed RNA polymerase specialized sigma24 family protein